jgi:vitamin B12 transporter
VAGSSWAAAPESNLTEVQVLGTQIEESLPADLQKYGSRLDVITSEQLRGGGYNDLSQALQMLAPGLYVAPKNGPFDYVDASLLGARTGDILYLVDGVRISNRLYNTTTPLDTIPAHMVERIEVLKGGQGLFYGTQAVAGVVNVVTKSFSEADDFGVGAGADSNDGKHIHGYLRGAVGNSQLVAFSSKDEADGFQPFRDQDYQPSGTDRERGYDVSTFGLKLAHQFSDPLTLSVLYQHTDATLDFAGPTETALDINERDEELLSVKLDFELNERFGIYLKSYYHDWTTHYTTIANDLNGAGQRTGTQSVWYDQAFWGFTDKGLNLMGRLRSAAGAEYLFGADLQRYSGRDEVYTIAPLTEEVKALFVQARSGSWLPSTQLALGARYNETSAGESATIWNLSGQQRIGDALYVRATLGTALRLPDAYQLYGAFINEFDTRGNPNLQPEKSANVDLGVGGQFGPAQALWNWEVTGFKREVKNLIGSDDDGFTDVDNNGDDDYDTIAVNTRDKVKMDGVELQLALTTATGWSASLDHTYSRPGPDPQIRHPLSQSACLAFRPAGARFSGGSRHPGWRCVPECRGSAIRCYTVVDAYVTARLDAAGRHRLNLSVANLLDEEYPTRLGTASPDAGGASYAYWHLGSPRTTQLRYTYALGAN